MATAGLAASCCLQAHPCFVIFRAFTKMAATPANYGSSGVKPMGYVSRRFPRSGSEVSRLLNSQQKRLLSDQFASLT